MKLSGLDRSVKEQKWRFCVKHAVFNCDCTQQSPNASLLAISPFMAGQEPGTRKRSRSEEPVDEAEANKRPHVVQQVSF